MQIWEMHFGKSVLVLFNTQDAEFIKGHRSGFNIIIIVTSYLCDHTLKHDLFH